jgi:hypothetical protein
MSTPDTGSNGTAGTHPTSTTPTTSNDPDAIRADIERTRNELASTVDALQAKLDVKAQAKARAARAKDRATTDGGLPRPEVVAGALGAVLLAVGVARWRKS